MVVSIFQHKHCQSGHQPKGLLQTIRRSIYLIGDNHRVSSNAEQLLRRTRSAQAAESLRGRGPAKETTHQVFASPARFGVCDTQLIIPVEGDTRQASSATRRLKAGTYSGTGGSNDAAWQSGYETPISSLDSEGFVEAKSMPPSSLLASHQSKGRAHFEFLRLSANVRVQHIRKWAAMEALRHQQLAYSYTPRTAQTHGPSRCRALTTCQQQCAIDRPPLHDAPCLAQALEVVRRLTAPSTSGHYEKVRQENSS